MAASRFVAALTSLVAVPFIIHDLGLTRFGVWESMVAMASLSSILTSPMGGTLLWRMSLAWGKQDGTAIRRLMLTGFAGALILSIVLLPIGLLIRPFVSRFLQVGIPEASTVQTLFLGLVALVFLTAINETLGALHSATQRVRVTSAGQTAGQITMHIVSVTGLRAGFGLPAMLLGVATGQLMTATLLLFGARKALNRLPRNGALAFPSHADAGKYFGLLTVGSVSAALRGQTDRLVLTWLASPVWAGYYSLAARLANLLMEFNNLMYVPTIAAAGALMGAGRWGAIRSLFIKTMKAASGGGSVLGVILIGLPGPLITLWVGKSVPEAALILRILSAGALVAIVLTGPGTAICKGIGRPGIETEYVVIGLVLNVVLTIGLSITMGAIGTVIASSASWSIGAFYFAFLLHRKLSLPRVPMRHAAATLVGVGVAALITASLLLVIPAPTTRLGALLMLLGATPIGIGALLVAGRLTGGLRGSDVTSFAISIYGMVQVPASGKRAVKTGVWCDCFSRHAD
jgi:O-antigen/teichoic acid export membrane protein